ncbi:MAG: hypothetical protein ACOCNW_08845, partial [Prevotella sp.]
MKKVFRFRTPKAAPRAYIRDPVGSLLQALWQAYGSRLEITFFPLSAKWAFFISNNSCLQGVDKNIKQRKNLGMQPV